MTAHITPGDRLKTITRHYLDDDEFLNFQRTLIARRHNTLPGLQHIIGDFVQQRTDIKTFRDELSKHLHQPEHDDWGAKGTWMMTLSQLVGNHDHEAETKLRQILDGLNAHNVAERFEDFAAFLNAEKQRHPQQIKKLAAPGISPYFITLLADWLDPKGNVIVVWPTVREGLYVLRTNSVLPSTLSLKATTNGIEVSTAEHYHAMQQAFDWINKTEPQLTQIIDWGDERFMVWVQDHKHDIPSWLESEAPVETVAVAIEDAALAFIPRERLAERIGALRRRLLIPEDLIERIYSALMLGQHVILSGPPGTGKTRLAEYLPRMLWETEKPGDVADTAYTPDGSPYQMVPDTTTAYDVRVVTATDEWTPRHVIGGIVPVTRDGSVRYQIAYGCLAQTIFDNWDVDTDVPATWQARQRQLVTGTTDDGHDSTYRGRWLVIDEFNRAPIDLALGEALTALGGGARSLQVPTDSGTAPLPMPRDFRIIGTLNTFDRHFLNEMSEALKRRFAFIDVLPPTRAERDAEQAMVLHQVLEQLSHIDTGRTTIDATRQQWAGLVTVTSGIQVPWEHTWDGATAAQQCFEEGWRLFEVIRLYRQFGTAQAITWATSFFGSSLLKQLDLHDEDGWRSRLGAAFADTLADQLQVLFPDEIEVLLAYLRTTDADAFTQAFHRTIDKVISPNRRHAQMMALQSITNEQGQPYLTAAQAEPIRENEQAHVPDDVLTTLFHANQPRENLPPFAERLERLLFERTI